MKLQSRQLALIAGGIVIAFVGGVVANYLLDLRPVSQSDEAQVFDIPLGQTAPTIADRLKSAGLIRDRNAFISYVNFHGLRPRIKAGSYSLRPSLSTPEIADIVADGRSQADRLVIPEGYTLTQIRSAAAKRGIDPADFDSALQATHPHAFLSGKPASVNMEGYLFPDSYQVGPSKSAADLITRMLDTFGKRVDQGYVAAFQAQGLTLHQGLTLASLVEEEVSIPADRPVVAQIFLKRYRIGMSLGSDSSTEYASKLAGVEFDLDINSPYNTRKFAGLPPGPICSPGLSALDAVAKPASTDYLYFLSGTDGKTYYAKTYPEHQRNIDKYLR